MSFFKIHSAQANLISANKIDIEIDISNGLYSFVIIGLGDQAINESKDRISSAIKYSGFKSPKHKNQKVVISLAPANQKKVGTSFDIPIALGYLAAAKQIHFNGADKLFIGELSLDGNTRKTTGIMQITHFAKEHGFKEIYVPQGNIREAAFIKNIDIYPVKNLSELILHLTKEKLISKWQHRSTIKSTEGDIKASIDLSEIKGNEIAKRGLMIAASGNHSIAFYGPPGTGKSMLARALSGIIPDLHTQQIIETTSIYSVSGLLTNNIICQPPFRAPHHTSSYSAIIGGNSQNKPGEITLAHNGILFLDELPEFDRRVINSLRQPIENKYVCVARKNESVIYPANFLLVVAMNPCPCGYNGTKIKKCTCLPHQIQQYHNKISGPIIDRIDMWVEVNNIEQKYLVDTQQTSLSKKYKQEVLICRKKQMHEQGKSNSDLSLKEIAKIKMEEDARKLLFSIYEKYKLSMRSFYKIIKIAKTISDLENSNEIKKPHILEAVQFRYKKY